MKKLNLENIREELVDILESNPISDWVIIPDSGQYPALWNDILQDVQPLFCAYDDSCFEHKDADLFFELVEKILEENLKKQVEDYDADEENYQIYRQGKS